MINFKFPITAWKMSKYGVFSVPYFRVFGLNTEKRGPEKTPYICPNICLKDNMIRQEVFQQYPCYFVWIQHYQEWFCLSFFSDLWSAERAKWKVKKEVDTPIVDGDWRNKLTFPLQYRKKLRGFTNNFSAFSIF